MSEAELGKVFELALALVEGMDRTLAEQGLSRARAEVLWALDRSAPLTQRQLAEVLLCSPRNVTALLDALERDDLVRRTRHREDRRAVLVELTDHGDRTAKRLRASSEASAAWLFTGIEPTDDAAFHRVVDILLSRVTNTR